MLEGVACYRFAYVAGSRRRTHPHAAEESAFQARPRRAWAGSSSARAAATGPGRQGTPRRLLLGDVLVGSRFEFTLGFTRCVLATLLRLEESGNTVANRASSSGDWTASALHRGQCLRLVGHTVTVEIDATEWAGDYIGGTCDASPYRDGTGAHTRTDSFRGVLERLQRPVRVVVRLLGLRGNV